MAAPRFHRLTLEAVRPETAEAVALRFAVPDALREAYAFTPGQYLTLRADIGGRDVRRSYSISSPLGAAFLEVGVKRIEGGAFSGFAQGLKAGDALDVMTPQGRFVAPVGGRHDYLLLAAGSGVTPMVSIARSVLEGEPESRVALLYANRATDTVMFREAFEDLKDRFLTRFRITHVMDEEAQDFELFNGRLDGEKLATMATRGLIDPAAFDAVFVCGPQPMIRAATEALLALGVEEARIRHELFTPEGAPPVASAAAKPRAAAAARIEVVLDGARRGFGIDPAAETVLEAAHRAGLELPYSCAGGMCCTCRCKVVEGDAAMDVNYSLEPWEIEAGYTLACQTRPKGARLVLDFDAA
ncbi:MAG: 2Fe-2S iron-sulfur cluster-binding protein [Pikeienuella sp.]|uniref:2Fe-2S iron-sulfur cluster-binding protein n=1 Tax=Pikeienuella sp. TaxID=2831957 RepID=UPI00391C963A